jgi:Ca-activated chloride channel family protein
MDVKADGYANYHLETYINRHQNSFIIELMRGGGSVVSRRPGSAVNLAKPESELLEQEEVQVQEKLQDESPVEQTAIAIEAPVEEALLKEPEAPSEFDASLYRLNNITFLIDVSTSMRQGHKMEVLRTALTELVDMLRPDDRVSFITYASSTEVLQSGISGAEKEQLDELIQNLKAEGLTAGEAGLKKAYSISKRHFIESGNNQVFLITDGALAKGYEKVNAMAAKQAVKEIKLSVIAISANKWAEKQMGTLAVSGQGVFLSVDTEEAAAQELKESIKQQSRLSP